MVYRNFFSAASQVSKQTQDSYRLVRLGSNNTPAILSPNPQNRFLLEAERTDFSHVQAFALSEAQYLAQNALGLPKSAQIVENGTSRTGNLWLSSFAVSFENIPLRERYLQINIGALSGAVMLVRNNIPAKQPNTLSTSIPEADVIQQTTNLLGSNSLIKSPPRLVFVDQKEKSSLLLCYELIASDLDMHERWRLTFDATTGELVEKKSVLQNESEFNEKANNYVIENKGFKIPSNQLLDSKNDVKFDHPLLGISGKVLAKVHLHNPFDTLTTVGLPYVNLIVNGIQLVTDSTGLWTLPFANYPLIIQTTFDGKYFSILRQDNLSNSALRKTILSGSTDVLWDGSNSDPSERDAFYSASYGHIADKRIDEKLKNIDSHMDINVNIGSTCNAFYNDADTSLNFFSAGTDCSNTAQVADVVFHEYGHRVTNARYQQASGQDIDIIDGSLGEGFADLNSAFIRDDPRIGIGFFGNNTKTLRNCQNKKKFPTDISQDAHVSGEIISGAFWNLREKIGLFPAEHLFHFMEYQMPDGIGTTDSASLEDAFASTLSATILTDDDDNNLTNGTPHLNEIITSFKEHNITLSRFIDVNPDQVKDQDTSATLYNVNVKASYSGIVGALDNKSIKVFYSTDNGNNYQTIALDATGNVGEFQGAIPKAPGGTIVKYYASAASNLLANDTISNPNPQTPFTFLVGFKKIVSDDAEQNRGWSLRAAADDATTGLWVREKPHGTFNDPTPPIQYLQQDTDHSVIGTMCYITGNHIDTSGNNDAGFDDVDNGATTLTTPAFDLSKLKDPVIRYWYYYSNNQGQNPDVAKWETDISNDGGVTWKSLQLTNQSTKGWTEFVFRLTDYLPASSSVKLRFIASDYVQALVEAGVDDLEILDPIETAHEGVIASPFTSQIAYPNPIHRGEALHISLPLISNGARSMTDLLGRTVMLTDLGNGVFLLPQSIATGIYFIELDAEKCKVVVEE